MVRTLVDMDEEELTMLLQAAEIKHTVATDIAKLIRRMIRNALIEEGFNFDD